MGVAVGDTLLHRVLLAPKEAARAARSRFHNLQRTIKVGARALDAAQVVCLGTTFCAMAGAPIGLTEASCLGLVAAALAGMMRQRLGTATVPCVVAAVGACVALVVPAPAMLLPWLLPWWIASAAVSGGLVIATAQLPGQLNPVALRVALVGDAERAGLRRWQQPDHWHVVLQALADAPDQMEELRWLALCGAVDLVVLALPAEDRAGIAEAQAALSDIRVRLCLALDVPSAGVRAGCNTPSLLDLASVPQAGLPGTAKRAVDLLLGGSALLVLAPVLAVAAIAIRLDSPGPVLFRQWRFGAGSRPIEVLKLRTMRTDAGDPTGERRTTAHDPRVTRLGRILRRTSIDELPQIINVLRGDMSLVGPRPHPLFMKVEDAYYFDAVEGYRARHRVRPGITGWAQVNGSRGEVDTMAKARHRVELDLWYIEHWSLGLDLWIVLRTILGGFTTFKAD